jgi:hypothetical protein
MKRRTRCASTSKTTASQGGRLLIPHNSPKTDEEHLEADVLGDLEKARSAFRPSGRQK